jgi:hypothetical protein
MPYHLAAKNYYILPLPITLRFIMPFSKKPFSRRKNQHKHSSWKDYQAGLHKKNPELKRPQRRNSLRTGVVGLLAVVHAPLVFSIAFSSLERGSNPPISFPNLTPI